MDYTRWMVDYLCLNLKNLKMNLEETKVQAVLLSLGGDVERCVQGFGGETWGKETTWETQA
jgi:hypothetical protein